MHLNNYKPHKLKLYTLVSLSILVLFSCSAHKNVVFYEKVLSEFPSRDGYFINITLDSSGVQTTYITENSYLRYYLYENQNVDYEKYYAKMLIVLRNDLPVVNSNPDSDFKKVTFILEVENNAAKGVEHFINTYCNASCDSTEVLKPGLTDEEQAAIINQLFKWRIGCFAACETGDLVIMR